MAFLLTSLVGMVPVRSMEALPTVPTFQTAILLLVACSAVSLWTTVVLQGVNLDILTLSVFPTLVATLPITVSVFPSLVATLPMEDPAMVVSGEATSAARATRIAPRVTTMCAAKMLKFANVKFVRNCWNLKYCMLKM